MLCDFCNSSKGNAFRKGECFICNNSIGSLDDIAEKASSMLPKNIQYFSVSTTLPNEWLAREELAWDHVLKKTMCIKTSINYFLNKKIALLSGKKARSDGDVIITVKFPSREVSISWNDLFIFGRYKKLKPGLSQTRWICSNCSGKGCSECDGEGKFYHSVEEEIGEVLKKVCEADDYVLHASGREDIDVTNIAGRPFVMQMRSARIRKPDLNAAAEKIKEKGNVTVHDLRICRRSAVEVITSSHFDKSYLAVVEFQREPTSEEINRIIALSGKTIKQKTPQRVEHRRAFLERERKVIDIKLISRSGKSAEFLITAEPGTYIKELVNGDEGRTRPSFSSVTGISARCVSLTVEKIFDDFLNTIRL